MHCGASRIRICPVLTVTCADSTVARTVARFRPATYQSRKRKSLCVIRGGLENRCRSYWPTESSNLSPSARTGASQGWWAIPGSGRSSRRDAGLPLKAAGSRPWGATTVAQLSRTTGASKSGEVATAVDGLAYLAQVIGRDGTRVRVSPITGPKGIRAFTSRDVAEHWRKVRPRPA
jgi:hypothetical protein